MPCGLNYSVDHLSQSGEEAKQDYAVAAQGPIVDEMRSHALRLLGESRSAVRADGPVHAGDSDALLAVRDNDRHRDDIERHYRLALHQARREVITSMNARRTPDYLAGYSAELRQQVNRLIEEGRLRETLAARYGLLAPRAQERHHDVRTDRALYDYVGDLKSRFMRNAPPLSKIAFDSTLRIVQHALGTHTAVSRVQGGKLKAKRELRVASLFKDGPEPFLKMIVVHELAHLREREHGKAFYALCAHMEPDYHRLEFDTRLWLTLLDLEAACDAPVRAEVNPGA